MQSSELYTHAKALDHEPAYRNVNYRSGPDVFDDLLDPDEGSNDAILLAFQKASRMRSNVSPVASLDQTNFYNIAIQGVFQRAILFPTRYGDGSYPVWYGSMALVTTIHETAYHMIREESNLGNHHTFIERKRMIFKVACTAILMDLTRKRRFYPQLADPNNYSFTQQVGKRIRMEQHPGLLAPSARLSGGINLAIFNPTCLSNPELADQLVYQLHPQSLKLTVFNKDHTLMTIDGRACQICIGC